MLDSPTAAGARRLSTPEDAIDQLLVAGVLILGNQ